MHGWPMRVFPLAPRVDSHGWMLAFTWLRAQSMESPGRAHQSMSEMTAPHDAAAQGGEAGAKTAAGMRVHTAKEAARLMFDREESGVSLGSHRKPLIS